MLGVDLPSCTVSGVNGDGEWMWTRRQHPLSSSPLQNRSPPPRRCLTNPPTPRWQKCGAGAIVLDLVRAAVAGEALPGTRFVEVAARSAPEATGPVGGSLVARQKAHGGKASGVAASRGSWQWLRQD